MRYLDRGRLEVSWNVPTGEFTAVTGVSVQVLRNGTAVEVRDNVLSPLTFEGLDQGSGYQFQVRAANQQGTSDWSTPSATNVPSGVPGAPSDLRASFVYDTAGARRIDVSWNPPGDNGGEPVIDYRVRIDGQDVGTVGSTGFSVPVGPDANRQSQIAVTARNNRGSGPEAGPVTVESFTRPTQVSISAVTPGDRSLSVTWTEAGSAGSQVEHYDYRVNDGGWTNAGVGTSATIGDLTNGSSYNVQVRACNGKADFSEDVRCGPPSTPVAGQPFGLLSGPRATVETTSKWGQTVTATWSFPESGNGREITSRTVTVSGAVEQPLDSSLGSWTSPNIGFGQSLKITVSYCVSGPSECTADVTDTAKTASPTALNTVAVGTLPGTCGLSDQSGADWPIDAAGCASGLWVPVGGSVDVLCVAVGTEYPVPATLPTTDKRWYLATDNAWYRFPAFATTNRVPNC